jgi:hypothetical protein
MRSRSLGARCAVLVTSIVVLGASSSMLAAAPASAGTNPSAMPCGVCEPAFTIEKLQEIAGSNAGFTTSKLIGKVGQTVDYEIFVTNTGDVPVTFSEFIDPHCEAGTLAGGPGTKPVDPSQSTIYTCSQKLRASGVYTNEATVTGSTLLGAVTKTSNRVVVEVPQPPPSPSPPPTAPTPAPAFTIEKSQEIAATKTGFTTAPLEGTIGETVDYRIIVKNTGNVALKFTSFADPKCDQPTVSGGPGEGAVAPGASTTYTCSHLLASTGKYVNQASVTGTAQGVAPLSETSNQVEVNVPNQEVKRSCERSAPSIHGATGPKLRPFVVRVGAAGIQQITYYLDGRKLRTLTQSQAKNGNFMLKINPRKLSHGAHTLTIRAIGTDPNCAAAAASSFVRPFPRATKVKFTG